MNDKPLVSIIIPFLNADKFIREAIESVFTQTYTSWELLLVDDGSTDKSTQIALDFTKRCPDKVFYFEHNEHQNKGSSASRNLGIQNSNGELIATFDADDIWVEDKLAQQVEILKAHPEVGMVYGNTKYWFSWSGKPEDANKDFYLHDKMQGDALKLNTVIHPPTLLILALESKLYMASMSNMLIRKKVAIQVHGFENNFVGMHDDQVFLAKVCLNTPIYISDSCWDLYRQHPDSCYNLAKKRGQLKSTELFYLNWLQKYLSRNNYTNFRLLQALQKRKWKYNHPFLYNIKKYYRKSTSTIKTAIKSIVGYLLPTSIRHFLVAKLSGKKHRPPIS